VSVLEGAPKVRSNGGEPALAGTISAAVAALVALAVAFGLDLNDTQQAAILGLVTVLGPIIAGAVIRSRVVPVKAVAVIKTDEGNVAAPGISVTAGEPVSVRPRVEAFPLQDPPRHLAD